MRGQFLTKTVLTALALFIWSIITSLPMLAETAGKGISDAGPQIRFDSLKYDFGRVMPNKLARHDFIFTNSGNETLIISNVQPSCDCIVPGEWTHQVTPGKTGTLPIILNGELVSGGFVRTVKITSNDNGNPIITLHLGGNVWQAFEIVPQKVLLHAVAGSSSISSASVHIVNASTEPITLSKPQTDYPQLAADLTTLRPGKEFRLTVNARPPFSPGKHETIFLINTSSTNSPIIPVPATLDVLPAIVITPPKITLPTRPSANSFSASVLIRNNTSTPLKLSDPQVDVTGVNVQIKPIQPGIQYKVLMAFPAGFQNLKGTNLVLSIKTSEPSMPIIKVPLL